MTANSQPIYPDSWCQNDYWKAGEWMQWFSLLRAEHGRKTARDIWYAAWTKFPWNGCLAQTRIESDAVFDEFMKREKLAEDDIEDQIEDTATNLSTFINILPWVVLLLIIFVVIFIIISIVGDSNVRGTAAKAAGSWLDRPIL